MKKLWRRGVFVVLDLVFSVLAALLAFAIRFGLEGRPVPEGALNLYAYALIVILPVRMVIYYFFGLYSQVWSQASVPELIRVVAAVTTDTLAAAVVIFVLPHEGFPRSVIVIGWFLKIGLLGGSRLLLRVRKDHLIPRSFNGNGGGTAGSSAHRALIYGAGDAGALLVREYAKHPELDCTVVGFIDDDETKVGCRVIGKPVLGTRAELPEVVKRHNITQLIIAMPSAPGSVIREVIQAGKELGLKLQTIPGIYELVGGTVSVSQIRDVQIEDLLGRDEVKVDLEAIAAYLNDQVVLVTGAGGSIGSELCRQVARFGPRQLLLLGHGENSIYEIHLELKKKHPDLELVPIIADIQDRERIWKVFARHRPSVVFHAAAHKHVPLMEANPTEAIKNNVFGTLNVAQAADRYKAKRFVLISSDKAVNPTSVMGATKRAAEYVVQSLNQTSDTVFVGVRFGNVLGSRGSVVPLFKRQIAAGGPVTVTDPRMVRYFMTIPEAVQLVIQAASMGRGGEAFVLDMGKPVRVLELARDMIRLSGLEPDVDIPIQFTGIRPGEKLFEELLTAEEGTVATKHERIYVARGDQIPPPVFQEFLNTMQQMAASETLSNPQVRNAVQQILQKVTHHGAIGAGD